MGWLFGIDTIWSRLSFYLGVCLVLGGLWFASDAIALSPPWRGKGDLRAFAQVVGLGTYGHVTEPGQLWAGRLISVAGTTYLLVLPLVLAPVLSRFSTRRHAEGRHSRGRGRPAQR